MQAVYASTVSPPGVSPPTMWIFSPSLTASRSATSCVLGWPVTRQPPPRSVLPALRAAGRADSTFGKVTSTEYPQRCGHPGELEPIVQGAASSSSRVRVVPVPSAAISRSTWPRIRPACTASRATGEALLGGADWAAAEPCAAPTPPPETPAAAPDPLPPQPDAGSGAAITKRPTTPLAELENNLTGFPRKIVAEGPPHA